jgi:hypothetical protein
MEAVTTEASQAEPERAEEPVAVVGEPAMLAVEPAPAHVAARTPIEWRPWLRVVGLAVALLAVSEALWVWQTWPVRELLQPAPARSSGSVR